MKKKLTTFVLAGVILAIAAGIAYAAIPSADGTISACKNSRGALKVIDAENDETCPDGQQLLTWNQQGPAGPQGPPGAALGYAFVTSDGGVVEQRSLNVGDANVTKPAGSYGVYCFDGLPFTPRVASVTTVLSHGSGSGSLHPTPEIGFSQGCPDTPGVIAVVMIDPSSGYWTRDKAFFVVFN